MPQVFWQAKESIAANDKCSWIVRSLAEQRTKLSRAVKVLDVDDDLRATLGTQPATDHTHLLRCVHSPEYIESVRSASRGEQDGGSLMGNSCGYVRALWYAALNVGATSPVGTSRWIVGSLGGGMHHARAAASSGGHAFNGLAIAARAFADEHSSVLILDLDGTCGGGTASLIAGMNDVFQVDIAVNDTDYYESTVNSTLRLVPDATRYLDVVRDAVEGLTPRMNDVSLCIYSAGIDCYEQEPTGLRGITAEVLAQRDRIVFDWCRRVNVPTAYTLGGGGESGATPRETVVALHRQTIEAAVAVMREESRK